MEVEVIHGQIIAKANHYQAVPGKNGEKRIIKEPTSAVSWSSVPSIAADAFPPVSGYLSGCGIVRSGSTLIIR